MSESDSVSQELLSWFLNLVPRPVGDDFAPAHSDPTSVGKPNVDEEAAQPRLQETVAPLQRCSGSVTAHARGATLAALTELQSLTHATGVFFRGRSKTEKGLRLELVKFLVERKICTASWARRLVREMFDDGWLEFTVKAGKPAIRVKTHKQWGSGRKDCRFGKDLERQHNAVESADHSPAEVSHMKSTETSAPAEEPIEEAKGSVSKPKESIANPNVSKDSKDFKASSLEVSLEEKKEKRASSSVEKIDSAPFPSVLEKQIDANGEGVATSDGQESDAKVSEFLELASSHRRSYIGRDLYLAPEREIPQAKSLVLKYGAKPLAVGYLKFLKDKDPYLVKRNHPWGLFVRVVEDYLPPASYSKEYCYDCCNCGIKTTYSRTVTPGVNRLTPEFECPHCQYVEETANTAKRELTLSEIPEEVYQRWRSNYYSWICSEKKREHDKIRKGGTEEEDLRSAWVDRICGSGRPASEDQWIKVMRNFANTYDAGGVAIPITFLEAILFAELEPRARAAYYLARDTAMNTVRSKAGLASRPPFKRLA